MPTSKAPNKIVYLEFLRIAACFLVIVNHTEESLFKDRGPSFTWFIGLAYFFICKIAVPLFLIVSGAVLLKKTDTPKKTIQRILRGAIVLAVASVIYYIYYGFLNGETFTFLAFLEKTIPTHITNAFWYLYLYLGILCLLPILQKLVKALDKREMQWLLFLSVGILGMLPLIRIFVPAFRLSGYFTGVLFSTYIGVMLTGYYIEKYVDIGRQKFYAAWLSFVLLISIQIVATYYLWQKNSDNYMLLDNRNFITITGSAVCFYVMTKYLFSRFPISEWAENALDYLGSCTFGIYLLGDLVIDLTRPVHIFLREHFHVILAMGLWELLVFTICTVITIGMKQIPGLKKWI